MSPSEQVTAARGAAHPSPKSEAAPLGDSEMQCLGECRKEHETLCYESGKCFECCDNECGCTDGRVADESRYENLCERAYLRSLPEVE